MLADLQHNRSSVAAGRAPLYEEFDSCAHDPLDAPPRPLESEEAPGFTCEFLFGSASLLPLGPCEEFHRRYVIEKVLCTLLELKPHLPSNPRGKSAQIARREHEIDGLEIKD
jgi:hypothetical protein